MKTPARFAAVLLAVLTIPLAAQSPEPTPAFAGQTDAPPPARPSPAFNVETIASGLTGAWAVAFLPDGNFLITQNGGTMRIVKPNGVVSAPIAGVPGVKTIGAQGLHDLLLDPDFARNRTLYFTYFAPPPGEAPGAWPLHFLYEDVWTKSLAERRLLNIGMEKVARARLSEDNQRLEDVRDLADGRRAAHPARARRQPARHRLRPLPLLRLRSRRQRAQRGPRPGRAPQLRGRRAARRARRLDSEGQPVSGACQRVAVGLRVRPERPRGRRHSPRDGRSVGGGPWPAGRRRNRHHSRRPRLRLARRVVRPPVRRASERRPEERQGGHRQHVDEGRRGADLLLGAVDRARRG